MPCNIMKWKVNPVHYTIVSRVLISVYVVRKERMDFDFEVITRPDKLIILK
jgi:hypothetical protein